MRDTVTITKEFDIIVSCECGGDVDLSADNHSRSEGDSKGDIEISLSSHWCTDVMPTKVELTDLIREVEPELLEEALTAALTPEMRVKLASAWWTDAKALEAKLEAKLEEMRQALLQINTIVNIIQSPPTE